MHFRIDTVLFVCLLPVALSQLFAQSNFQTRMPIGKSVVTGEVTRIDGKSRLVEVQVREVISGDPNLSARQFSVGLRATFTGESARWIWNRDDFPRTPLDQNIYRGAYFVFVIDEGDLSIRTVRPIRYADRYEAMAEIDLVRRDLASRADDVDYVLSMQQTLMGRLRTSPIYFWEEWSDGALVHPNVEELLRLIFETEEKTGHSVIAGLVSHHEESLHLRTAAAAQWIKKDRAFITSPAFRELIGELRKNARSPQDAIALLAVMDEAYATRKPSDLDCKELVREALDPALRSSEYRFAFAQRLLRKSWGQPAFNDRLAAVIEQLESESCEPAPEFRHFPLQSVGDCLIFHLVWGQMVKVGKPTALYMDLDLSKLHPTVKAKLKIADAKPLSK